MTSGTIISGTSTTTESIPRSTPLESTPRSLASESTVLSGTRGSKSASGASSLRPHAAKPITHAVHHACPSKVIPSPPIASPSCHDGRPRRRVDVERGASYGPMARGSRQVAAELGGGGDAAQGAGEWGGRGGGVPAIVKRLAICSTFEEAAKCAQQQMTKRSIFAADGLLYYVFEMIILDN